MRQHKVGKRQKALGLREKLLELLRLAPCAFRLSKFLKCTRAFSLIEVALVLAIIGIMAGISLPMLGIVIKKQTFTTTTARMTAATDALQLHARQFGRLPCPASPRFIEGGRNPEPIGSEMGSGALGDKPATQCRQFIGLLPYRTLGIAPETAVDGWNRPITYAVSPNFAVSKKPIQLVPEEEEAETKSICDVEIGDKDQKLELFDAQNLPLAPNQELAFVLLSHGNDGGGAFLSEGTGGRQPVISLFERFNGDNDLKFRYQPYRNDPKQGFDDILVWRTKTQIATAFNGQLCADQEDNPEPEDEPAEMIEDTETEMTPIT